MNNQAEEIAERLYNKAFERYCTELSHDKNKSRAKAISIDMAQEVLEEAKRWKDSYMGRKRAELWGNVIRTLQNL